VTIIPNGGNDGRKINDLGGSTRTPRAARPQGSPGDTPAGPAPSSLHMSARGERFLSLRTRLDGLEASRPERLERLTQLVAAGQYQPDSEAIAAAMLNDPATAAALGMRDLG
jgi:anti-sigma28 factor (negative regulator of flagellin synthesis)